MKTFVAPAAFAAAMLLSSVSVDAILAPASAQDDASFDSFHDYLANYGDWVYSDRWGEVWVPENVPDDFQPYGTNGYWAATDDYGWVWVSNYEWGDVPFHYGRWVNDPDDGWLWIPGYVWSPAWVVWRHSGDYTGWMPMPPDPVFLGQGGPSMGIGLNIGAGISIGIDFNDTGSYYGYSQWYPGYSESSFASNWVFVGTAHLADPNFQHYWAPRNNYVTIIHNTTNITNYTVVNNYIVNKGVDVTEVQRASGHPIQKVALQQAIKHPQFMAQQANKGVQIQTHMRQIRPRGTGKPNSAPAPSAKVVEGLSNKVPQHGGHPPAHVFTKTSVTKAPAFAGKIAPGGGATHGPATMSGPAGGPNVQEEKSRKPAETGGAPTGETMHGPGGMKGPGSTAAPQEEKLHKPKTGGTSSGGSMSAPPEHRKTQPTPPPAAAPVATPPVQHVEHRPPPAAAPVAAPPVQHVEHRQLPAGSPAATPPVQHIEHKAPPAAQSAPPPKPEDKDKKDKDKEPH